jgi:GNAT superfamily N-acetyltransferase
MPHTFAIASARADDAADFIRLRGRTRENAISEAMLASYGITASTWAEDVRAGLLVGFTATLRGRLVGYCFGNAETGEVVVLALLPEAESQGVGRELLGRVVSSLRDRGHRRLFLGCSTDPAVRSYGFYRHLGWRPTGVMDSHGDEVLELD